MPFTVEEFKDLVRLLEERPEWRAELRRLILTDELLELPRIVRDLAEKVDGLAERVDELARQNRVLAQRVDELAEQNRALAQRVDELAKRVDELAEQNRALAQRVDELAKRVDELAEQNRALAQRVDELAEQNRMLTRRVDELARQNMILVGEMEKLTDRVESLADQVAALVRWQSGEAARREGERFERRTIRNAPLIFAGGDGGAPDDPVVRRKLSEWLKPLFREGRELSPEEAPTEADLIWWKEDKVAVAEISITVDKDDVERAYKRAETLKSVGVDAFPVVIGDEWAFPDVETEAKKKGVEWFIKGEPSSGLIAFRKLGLD